MTTIPSPGQVRAIMNILKENKAMTTPRIATSDYNITYTGETWHITKSYISSAGHVMWYAGSTIRNGIPIVRSFSEDEIDVPEVSSGS